MLRRFAALSQKGDLELVQRHPLEITALLERGWSAQLDDKTVTLGFPDNRSDIYGLFPQIPSTTTQPVAATTIPAMALPGRMSIVLDNETPLRGIRWDHLIYAYMIEQTRIYEIFRRVVQEFSFGEKLGPLATETQLWLRNTEEIFYRDPPPFSITNVSSHIRSDMRASRRNLYQRMFGMELNHGTDENAPYPYPKAEAANNEFVATFEELLREVWVGITNRDNSSGTKATDNSKIEELAKKLRDMLITRRQNGMISREEFFFVSMMSWFHMTVENNDFPVIKDLRANGASAEQRLFKIAQMVGLPAHGLSRNYFEIAEPLSALLIAIESGVLHENGAARALYDPTAPNTLADTMNKIITHWSIVTGHDIKAGKVAVR